MFTEVSVRGSDKYHARDSNYNNTIVGDDKDMVS